MWQSTSGYQPSDWCLFWLLISGCQRWCLCWPKIWQLKSGKSKGFTSTHLIWQYKNPLWEYRLRSKNPDSYTTMTETSHICFLTVLGAPRENIFSWCLVPVSLINTCHDESPQIAREITWAKQSQYLDRQLINRALYWHWMIESELIKNDWGGIFHSRSLVSSIQTCIQYNEREWSIYVCLYWFWLKRYML